MLQNEGFFFLRNLLEICVFLLQKPDFPAPNIAPIPILAVFLLQEPDFPAPKIAAIPILVVAPLA